MQEICGEAVCLESEFLRHLGGDRLGVPGEHHRFAHARLAQGGDRLAGVLLDLVVGISRTTP